MSDWRDRAACNGLPVEWWFSDLKSPEYRRARTICQSCPVRWECLEHAVNRPERYGIWGACGPDERVSLGRQIRRRLKEKREAAALG